MVTPVYLTVGPDKNLYYISRLDDAVYQIHYPATLSPSIDTDLVDVLVGQGWPATFSCRRDRGATFALSLATRGVAIPGAADSPSYTLQIQQWPRTMGRHSVQGNEFFRWDNNPCRVVNCYYRAATCARQLILPVHTLTTTCETRSPFPALESTAMIL